MADGKDEVKACGATTHEGQLTIDL